MGTGARTRRDVLARGRSLWAWCILCAALLVSCARPHPLHTAPALADRSPARVTASAPGALLATPPPKEFIEPFQRQVSAASALFDRDRVRERANKGIVRVAVISDMNGSYGSTRYGKEVKRSVRWLTDELKPDLVISTGDMVAGMKHGLDYEAMWVAFHATVTSPLTRAGIPFAPTPGNHDATSRPGYGSERVEYARQWRIWRPELDYVDARHFPRRYAFIKGGVLFISLDATNVGRLSEAQMTWLDAVLSRHAHVPVKLVYGHLPIYPFAKHRDREVLGDRGLEELLTEHHVTAYISGHHHTYYPGKRGSLRMVSMSCLGGGPRKLIGQDEVSPRSVLVMEIDPAVGILSLEAHRASDFSKTIEREDLPEVVGQGEALMTRDDL